MGVSLSSCALLCCLFSIDFLSSWALHEGGVAGVVEGLAQVSGAFFPLECLGEGERERGRGERGREREREREGERQSL